MYVHGVGNKMIGIGDIVAYPVKGKTKLDMRYAKVYDVDPIQGRLLVKSLGLFGCETEKPKVWIKRLNRVTRVHPRMERSFKSAVQALLDNCSYE